MKSFSSSPHILLLKSMSMFTSPGRPGRGGGRVSGCSWWHSRRLRWWWWLQEQNWLQPQFFWEKVCMREAGNLIAVLEQSPGELSQSSLPSLSHLRVHQLWTEQRLELFYLLLILYAKQEWLDRSFSLLGVLISEYFQHHKWISSVLTSIKYTLKAPKFCIEMRGARLDKKPRCEWHCHYKMFVYWWLSH